MIAEARQSIPGGPQEIIRLLQNELAETNREVMLLTVELDKRVQERTAELVAAQSELRQKNAELLSQTAQLETANKELEAFSYSISHDLRAPLRHISGYLSALTEESASSLSEDARKYLEAISTAAERMSTLIEDLLTFSRTSRAIPTVSSVDMTALVREVIRELSSEIEGRDIVWEVSSLPTVTGDLSLLKQVWTNLLSNSIKYTRPRTPATISIGCDEKSGGWEFSVQDNGVGFDMRYADKLFGVFQRLHSQDEFEGTGIGLANVRQIVRRHGGDTRAESQVDVGTTIYFSLPKSTPPPETRSR
jgi:light-regulated signal transduction histidine kinase (bacteriophytochrome)